MMEDLSFTYRGQVIRAMSYTPERYEKTLWIIHGFSQHSVIYENLIDHLLKLGVKVYFAELQGFGLSEGRRSHVHSYREYLECLRQFHNEKIREKDDLILFGHSMGGLLATFLASEGLEKYRGLVLSAPFFSFSKFAEKAIRCTLFLNDIFRDDRYIALNNYPPRGTGDHKLWPKFGLDPIRSKIVHTRFLKSMLRAHKELTLTKSYRSLPVLFLTGARDKTVCTEAINRIFCMSNPDNRQMVVGSSSLHELNLDFNRENHFNALGKWLLNL